MTAWLPNRADFSAARAAAGPFSELPPRLSCPSALNFPLLLAWQAITPCFPAGTRFSGSTSKGNPQGHRDRDEKVQHVASYGDSYIRSLKATSRLRLYRTFALISVLHRIPHKPPTGSICSPTPRHLFRFCLPNHHRHACADSNVLPRRSSNERNPSRVWSTRYQPSLTYKVRSGPSSIFTFTHYLFRLLLLQGAVNVLQPSTGFQIPDLSAGQEAINSSALPPGVRHPVSFPPVPSPFSSRLAACSPFSISHPSFHLPLLATS